MTNEELQNTIEELEEKLKESEDKFAKIENELNNQKRLIETHRHSGKETANIGNILQEELGIRTVSMSGLTIVNRVSTFLSPSLPANPTPITSSFYYNTAVHKLRVCENGIWRTITTS